MYEVNSSRVPKWIEYGDHHVPASVKTVCPFCNSSSTLTTVVQYVSAQAGKVIAGMDGDCTQCDGKSMIWVINPRRKGVSTANCEGIWMLPIPQLIRREATVQNDFVPERIYKAYIAALECFNSQVWTSAINECGRVIEGITQNKFPTKEKRKELKKILEELDKNGSVSATLFKSILELSKAVRLSRRSGSHFDFTNDPDAEIASKVIDLTEYALEYFYGLPQKADDIGKMLDELEPPNIEDETSELE